MSDYSAYIDPNAGQVTTKEHTDRVRRELIQAGMSRYGLLKGEAVYLPGIIGPYEHIGGVVYGQSSVGSVMLVATDQRIIYLDRKPFMLIKDDISYNVISGVRLTKGVLFTSITLHTRIHDFSIHYTNANCARRFEQFITERVIEHPADIQPILHDLDGRS